MSDQKEELTGSTCGQLLRTYPDEVIVCELDSGHPVEHISGPWEWSDPFDLCGQTDHLWEPIVLGCKRCGMVHDDVTNEQYYGFLPFGFEDKIGMMDDPYRRVPPPFSWPPPPSRTEAQVRAEDGSMNAPTNPTIGGRPIDTSTVVDL